MDIYIYIYTHVLHLFARDYVSYFKRTYESFWITAASKFYTFTATFWGNNFFQPFSLRSLLTFTLSWTEKNAWGRREVHIEEGGGAVDPEKYYCKVANNLRRGNARWEITFPALNAWSENRNHRQRKKNGCGDWYPWYGSSGYQLLNLINVHCFIKSKS